MTNIGLGQTIDGSLSSTDTKNPEKLGSFSDEYTLSGFSNWQRVQVNMDSTAINSYLQLVNASTGEEIDFNDGLFSNTDAGLKFTVIPGVNYMIRATSRSPNQTGNYTLKTSSLGNASSLVSTAVPTIFSANGGKVGSVDSAGNFVKITNSPNFDDIALSSDNRLFGITNSKLYNVDPVSGSSSSIGNLGASVNIVGLAFSPSNVLYGTGGSNLYTINQTTGAASLVANLGSNFDASGDLIFDPVSNRFLATSVGNNNDSLFSVSLTGQATKIGNIGFNKVFGLSFEGSTLVGFTASNQRIVINPATGVGTLDKDVTGLSDAITIDAIISGATSIATATPIPTPTPPTPTPPTPTPPTPTPPTVVTPTPTPPTVVTPTPTPPTVVTPPPLTIPIPIQTSTVPPSQIPKPDSSGEVDLNPLKLKVINGQFTFNDKTKRYEASGTIQIGRKDGKFPLINVQQGKVEYDDKTVSVDGTVFSSIGNVTPPLFKGKFDLDVKTATATSVKEERGSLPTEFKLSGLDIDFKALALNRDGIGLGVKFKLPNTVGGIIIDSVAQSPDTIFIGEKGPRFDTTIKTSFQDFSLLGLLPVTKVSDFSIAYIPFNETLKIQGKFSTKPFIKEEKNSTTKPKIDAIPEIIADLSGENFIQIKDGKTDIKGSLGIKNLKFGKIWGLDAKLTLDTINKDIGGDAKLTYAFGNGVPASENTGFGLGLGFKLPIPPVELNRIKGELDLSNFPIFNTGFYLQEVAAEIDNIAPSDPDPFQLTLNGRVTAGPEVSLPSLEKPFSLFDADLTLIAKADRSTFKIEEIKGSGKFKMLSDRIGKFDGGVTLNLNKKTVDFQVGTSFFEDFIKGELGFKTDFGFKNINGTGNASINIPQSVPLFGGQKIGEGKLLLDFSNDNKNDNDFVAGWGRLDIKKLGVEISFVMGAKRYFDGRIERIGAKDITATNELQAQSLFDSTLGDIQAKNIPETNSFIVSPGTKYIILGADSENTASNMAVQVKAPNGKIFSESDFAATGKIAVVDELTDSNTKSVIVLNPEPGVWNINVANPSGLGRVQYTAVRDSEAPTIQVAAPSKDVSGQNVTINYNAFDADSTAKVSLFYDNDNKGFDGILIKGGLEEKDGAGNFVWNTQGLPTGDYYVYAMAMDENNAPVFSYAPLPIKVTESADLSVTKTADRDTAIPGSNVTYTVAVTNNGTDNAKGAILTETLPDGAKFVSANITPTKQSGNDLTFDLGDVAKGQISTVSITVTAPTTGNITGTSSITSKTYDPDISNDFDFASTTVTNDGTESATDNVVATPTPTPPRPPLRQVLGTPENDNLVGIDAADSIAGFAGDDTLAGLGGDDIIYGNKGNDIITGNSGNDNIFGGRGNDLILERRYSRIS